MMNIALISSLDYHFECFGFLLESLSNHNLTIITLSHCDKFGYLEHYSSIYKFKICYEKKSAFDIMKNYDKVFKITSDDKCIKHKEVVSILHVENFKKGCKSQKKLSLTPVIRGCDIFYTFPVYCPAIKNSKESKTVTMVGYYSNDCIDLDTITFINNNSDYIFNFVINNMENCFSNLENIKNVKLYNSINAVKLTELINLSKFVLSRKFINYDRFSGQFGLALSFEKPIIIDYKSKKIYKIPGIVFKKDYCELGLLKDITDDDYYCLVHNIKIMKSEILINNRKTLIQLLPKLPSLEPNKWLAYKEHWKLINDKELISLSATYLKKNNISSSLLRPYMKLKIKKNKMVSYVNDFDDHYYTIEI